MNILLFPLSLIYRIGVFFRNALYNAGIFKTKVLDPKVISVGNLSAGGTGKTPLVELITEYLLKKNKFVVVVSKGYKREYDDIKVVEVGFTNALHELNTENMGDESLMMLENLSHIETGRGLLVVGDDKTKAAKFAASKFKPEIIIVDDGFQHRKLYRDLDILIINPDSPGGLIPAGKLREPKGNYKRADILIINNKFDKIPVNENYKNKPKVICSYTYEGLFNFENKSPENITGEHATVFCGIGEPGSFKTLVNEIGLQIDEFITFPDHHNFANDDILKILSIFKSKGSKYLLTTQKDFVRLRSSELVLNAKSENSYKNILYNYPLYYAKIKMQIDQNSELLFKDIDNLLSSE